MKKTVSTKESYRKSAMALLAKKFSFSNPNEIPRIQKVSVNIGIGKYLKDDNSLEEVKRTVTDITGQKPVLTKARKAVAGFKIRQGLEVGMKVTLRGTRMWHFLDRLSRIALPRIRDFQGLRNSSVDQNGNLNIGVRDHIVFPEISAEKMKFPMSMQITVVSTAKSKDVGVELYRALGFPIK